MARPKEETPAMVALALALPREAAVSVDSNDLSDELHQTATAIMGTYLRTYDASRAKYKYSGLLAEAQADAHDMHLPMRVHAFLTLPRVPG